jgi:NAD(P)-dependent dehydrogenase (short-subunit alcohol dehydrogenase family)
VELGLRDRVLVVTGGASGIGRGIVDVLAAEGAIVVIVDRNAGDAGAAVSALDAPAGQVYAVRAELTTTDQCRQAIAAVVKQFNRIDGLVNNAGENDRVGLETGDADRFLLSLRRNLTHYYDMAHFALPELKKTQGAIVNISSKVAETGQGGTSAYAAANGGRNALTREWAVELAKHGIRVNAVIVAECWTPLYARWLQMLPATGSRAHRGKNTAWPTHDNLRGDRQHGGLSTVAAVQSYYGATHPCRRRLRSPGPRDELSHGKPAQGYMPCHSKAINQA